MDGSASGLLSSISWNDSRLFLERRGIYYHFKEAVVMMTSDIARWQVNRGWMKE